MTPCKEMNQIFGSNRNQIRKSQLLCKSSAECRPSSQVEAVLAGVVEDDVEGRPDAEVFLRVVEVGLELGLVLRLF